MEEYLDGIIKCSIESSVTATCGNSEAPLAVLEETNAEFAAKLAADSNCIASKCQMHSMSHNATCFKYGAAASQKYRFNFLHPTVEQTNISNVGGIEMRRNNGWVNSWNPGFVSLF